MTTLGKTTDGTGSSSSTANKTVVSQFTASASGTVTDGHARLWVDSGSANVEMVVYADSSGAPGALLGQSGTVTISNTTEAQIDFTFSGANQASITNGTAYWVGFTWPDPGTNSVFWSRDTTASSAQQNSSHAANPFGTPTALSGPIDAYVDFTSATPISGSDSGTVSSTSAVTVTISTSDSGTLSDSSLIDTLGQIIPRTARVFEQGSTGTVSPDLTGSRVDDFAIVTLASSSGGTVTGPTGWTPLFPNTTFAGNRYGSWYRRLDGTANDNSSLTMSGTGTVSLITQCFGGVDPTTPLDTVVSLVINGSAGSTVTLPSVTTVKPNTILVSNVAADTTSSTNSPVPPGTMTQQASTSGTGRRQHQALQTLPSAGDTGSRVWTKTGTTDVAMSGWMVALRPKAIFEATGTDTATLTEVSQVSTAVAKSGSDSAALTETSQIIDVTPVGPGTDSAALASETAELTIVESYSATDSGTVSSVSQLTVTIEASDSATLSSTVFIDRPPESGEVFGLVEEASELTQTTVGDPFYFGPDQYFGEDVYFGGGTGVDLPPGVDPTGGVDPDRDGGFTASQTGAEPPADFAVLVAITTTGEIVDELNWQTWNYTDSVDWARPGSMRVTVPLLGKDRLGELNRQSLKNVNSAGPTVSLVLTRKGKALFAGPVTSMSWNDDSVEIQCSSIAKLMDSRIVIDPEYLLQPGNTDGNVSFELGPRDLVIKLLELGTTGDRRALPMQLPTISGTSGSLVEYLAADLGTVTERIKEQVEQEGGPDVVIHPELDLNQANLVWKVQVEEHIGSTESVAAWDYPVTVKSLTGDTDSSQMVTTGYVLGDTQTSVGSVRGFGVHSIDRGSLPPALERADRTSVSNKRQDELDALAVSFVEANSVPAETWSVSVHAEAEPTIGEEWNLGDYVTISVVDHPWLDDGEYVRRIVGITHDPETIQLETVEVSREIFPVIVAPIPPPPVLPPGTGTPPPVTPPPPPPDPTPTTPTQTRGVGGVATPAGAVLTTANSSSKLKITVGGTESNPKVYDGQGHTVGGLQVEASWVIVQNFKVRLANGSGVYVRAANVTVQNCDVARVRVGDSSAPNEDDINGVTFFGDGFTLQYCDIGKNDFLVDGDPAGSHTDGCQTWNNDPSESSSNVKIRFNWFDGPPISDPRYLHQGITVEGKDATSGGGGGTGDTTDWLIEGNFFRTYGNQVFELRDIQRVTITKNTFAGSASKIVNQGDGTSDVVFASDNIVTGSYGSIGA